MNFKEVMTIILGSSSIAAFIGYQSSKRADIGGHKRKYITEERQKWWKDIKERRLSSISYNFKQTM